MPVDYLCVQCYICKTFQVQQSKKKPQFTCAVCHEKQSIRKVCAVSSKAADVRAAVQQLNMARAQLDANPAAQQQEDAPTPSCSAPAVDWEAFVESAAPESDPEDDQPLHEVPKNAANPRKRARPSTSAARKPRGGWAAHCTAQHPPRYAAVTLAKASEAPPGSPKAAAGQDPWGMFLEPQETSDGDDYNGA